MRIKTKHVSFSVLLLSLLLSVGIARAALVEVDLVPSSGDKLLTRDTVTALDWLDLTQTLNLSFNDIQANVGGFISAGFRFATESEVRALYQSVGIINLTNGPPVAGNFSGANLLLQLMGCTGGCAGNSPFFQGLVELDGSTVPLGDPRAGQTVMVLDLAAQTARGAVPCCLVSKTDRSVAVGSYLVRPASAAGQLNVNPEAYTGQWFIQGVTATLSGAQTVAIGPGNYNIGVGAPGSPGSFQINIATNGMVTVLNGASAIGGFGTLTFNTASLAVNPAAYTGVWHLGNGVTTTASGSRTLPLVLAVNYAVIVGAPGSIGRFDISFAADTTVSVLNGVSAVGGVGTLTFNTASLAVNPAAYSGVWHLGNGITTAAAGFQTLTLVPAVNYAVIVGAPGSIGRFDISFAADTTVSVLNGVSAVGGVGTLTFNTASLAVNPSAYAGSWLLGNGVTTPAVGTQTVTLVPAVNYRLVVGTFGSPGSFDFSFAGDGAVTVFNGISAVGGASSLTFNTVAIQIAPGTFSGTWDIHGVIQTTGTRLVKVVPNITYRIKLLVSGFPQQDFSVSGPCAVAPSQFSLGGFPITITCGPPTANAGPDQTVNEGALVTLDGSGSSASQGGSLTFTWTQLGGAAVSLNLTDPVRPTFTAPFVSVGGDVLTFRLVVTEGAQNSEPDVVNIHVTNVNNRPVADAGADQTVQEGSPVVLNGSNSFDPDAETLSFSWVQTAGTAVSLPGANTANPSFTAPLVGPTGMTLTFELTVSDGIDAASDSVNVLVENVNHRPIANAGSDQTRDEGSLVTLNGTGSSDPDGDGLNYTWTQTSGPLVALSGANTANPSFTAPTVGPGGATLGFRLVVDDGLGGVSDPDEVKITVQNINDPPACNLAQPSLSTLWPPNHKLVAVGINNVSDPNNDQVAISITGITQDEPVNGLGDGDTSPDAVLQGDKVLLRVERAENGNGRVYRVSFSANDGQGGVCGGSVNVSVPKNMQPGNNAVDDGQLYDSTQP